MEPEQQPPFQQLEQAGENLAEEVQRAAAPERQIRARERAFLLAYLAFLAGAVALALLARQMDTFPGDVALARALQAIGNPLFAALMATASVPGYALPAAAISLVIFAFFLVARRPLEAIFIAVAAGTSAVAWALKLAVGRPRPTPDLVAVFRAAGDASFPSGHVVQYVVFYGFLLFLAYTQLRRSTARSVLLVLLALPVLLVGPSRVYLGAHWPSDVAGAYLVGALLLAPLIWVYSVLRDRRQGPSLGRRRSGIDLPE